MSKTSASGATEGKSLIELFPSIEKLKEMLEDYAENDQYCSILSEIISNHEDRKNINEMLLPFYTEDIKSQVIQHMDTLKKYEKEFALLTVKEEEVIKYLAKECTRKQIAAATGSSEGTIKKHCEHIYKKLGTNDRIEIKKIVDAYLG